MAMQRSVVVPLPEAFGQVFGFWVKDPPRGEFVFARAAGQQPVSAQAARADRRGMGRSGCLAGSRNRASITASFDRLL